MASPAKNEVPASAAIAGVQVRAHEGAAKSFWRILTRFDSSKLQPYLALRNTAGVVLPLNMLAGGCLSLLVYAVWPIWERAGGSGRIAQVLDVYREYFHALTQEYVNSASAGGVQAKLNESRVLDEKRLATRRARSNLEASIDRVSAEPGTTAEQMNQLNAILVSSHRFMNAVKGLEAGWRHTPPSRTRAELGGFAEDVEKTLELLAKMLGGEKVRTKDFPDLREDHQRLLQADNSRTEQYALVNVEADRITNSLNTLREQVTEWVQAQKGG